MKHHKIIKSLILTVFFLVIVWAITSYISHALVYKFINLDPQTIVRVSESYGVWAFLIYFLIMVFEVIFAPIQPFPFYIAGSILFGPFIAGVLACLGGAIGGVIAFQIAKKLGRKYAEKLVSQKQIKKFDDFSKKYGGISLFFLRLNPITSTDAWSYIAGVSKISLVSFTIWTFLGLIPSTFLQTYLGIPIKNNPLLFKLFMVVVVIYFFIVVFLIIYANRRVKKR